MGRLGGCADLNLGTPEPAGSTSRSLAQDPDPDPDPDRRSVKDLIHGGGAKVKPAWSKLPVEDAMAIDRSQGDGRLV